MIGWHLTADNTTIRLDPDCNWFEHHKEIVSDAECLLAATGRPIVIKDARGRVLLTVKTPEMP